MGLKEFPLCIWGTTYSSNIQRVKNQEKAQHLDSRLSFLRPIFFTCSTSLTNSRGFKTLSGFKAQVLSLRLTWKLPLRHFFPFIAFSYYFK